MPDDVIKGVGVLAHWGIKSASGRWLCTITACFVWIWMVVHNLLPPAFNSALIMYAVKSYFDDKSQT